jgi:hypothetical protein
MNNLTTAESRALKSSFEAMGKLTRAYNSHKTAILADTRLRFEVEAKQQLKWLIEYAEITKDSGVLYAVGEAKDVLKLMENLVDELIQKELENAKGQLTQAQLKRPDYVARVVGCSVDWASTYFEKNGRL